MSTFPVPPYILNNPELTRRIANGEQIPQGQPQGLGMPSPVPQGPPPPDMHVQVTHKTEEEGPDLGTSVPGRHPMDEKPEPQARTLATFPSQAQPRPLIPPLPTVPKSASELAHQAEYSRLTAPPPANPALLHTRENTGAPGIQQVHNPLGRGLLTALDAVGSGLFPRIAMSIPGTSAHHALLVNEQKAPLEQEELERNREEQQRLEEAKAQYQMSRENPAAKLAANEIELFQTDPKAADAFMAMKQAHEKATATGKPEIVRDGAGNILGIVDSKGTPHSATDPLLDPEMKKMIDAAKTKEPATPEAERPLGTFADQMNAANQERYQVLNPGKPLPPQYRLTPASTQKQADEIRNLLGGTETAVGVKSAREQAAATAAANRAQAEERPGKTALDKAEATYRTAQQSANDLRNFISMAEAGNKVTAQAIPLEGTLAIVTSQGVKRINRTEVEYNQAAGSLFDNIMGKVGKLKAGQPVPPDILKDWTRLADMMEKSSYQTYKGAFDSAKKRYHLTDEEPLPEPKGGGGTAGGGSTAGWSVKVLK